MPETAAAVVIYAQSLPSQPEGSASLKIYPIKSTNFTCRIGISSGDKKRSEILLTSEQMSHLATDLMIRVKIMKNKQNDEPVPDN